MNNQIEDIKTIEELVDYCENQGEEHLFSVNKEKSLEVLSGYFNREISIRKYTGIRKIFGIVIKMEIIRKKCAKRDAEITYKRLSSDAREKYSKECINDLIVNKDNYLKAYELLYEDAKHTYLDILKFRITGDYKWINRAISGNNQYFSNKIKWRDSENVVDCGAFIGDTLLAFINNGIRCSNYYLYELEDDNYKQLLDSCEIAKKHGICVYPKKKGVYNKTGELYFKADKDSSTIVDYKTDTSIPVVKLDDEINGEVSFIKMDIEGSECEALAGAQELIKKNKPTLAICIYHKQEDFWKIPLLIHEICPEYKNYWVEHYTMDYIESVLFVTV